MLAHAYNIIIDRGVGAPGHGREVVDGLNDTEKRLLSILITTVQMTGAEYYDSQTANLTSTENTYISLARERFKIVQTQHGHTACWITVSTENVTVNGSGQSMNIISNTENMCHTHH